MYFRAKVTRILPLKHMEFTTILKGSELKNIKHKVAKYGGTLVSKCTENIAAVFAIQGIFQLDYPILLSYSFIIFLNNIGFRS